MKRLSFFLKLAVSGLLLFFLFDRIDLADVYTVYKQSNHMLLIGAFALVLLGESLCVVRLRVLLALRGALYSFKELFRIYFMGVSAGSFLPSSLGADVFKFFLLRKHGAGSKTDLASSLIADRIAGSLGLLLIVFGAALVSRAEVKELFSLVFGDGRGEQVSAVLLVAALVLFVLGYVFRAMVLRMREEAQRFLSRRRAIAKVMSLAVLYQLLLVGATFLIYQAISSAPTVSALSFLVFVPLINLVIALPISINGIGVREWLFVLLFSPLGAASSEMVAVSLMLLFFIILEGAIGGLFFSTYERFEVNRISPLV